MPIGEDVEDLQFGHQLVEVIGKQRTLVGVRVLDEEGIIAHFLVTSIASHQGCFQSGRAGQFSTPHHQTEHTKTINNTMYTLERKDCCVYMEKI